MSDVKIEDLSPVPFFAHFLESHFSRNLTAEEMKALRGGSCTPNEMDAEAPIWGLPDVPGLIRRLGPVGQVPGNPLPPVTMAYPSDGEVVPL